jgi:hypothetical protein
VHRAPAQFGQPATRGRWDTLRATLGWPGLTTPAGLWQVLRRLGIHYKQARDYVHSPDPNYEAKLALIAGRRAEVRADPERYVLLYLDECTYYRQPSLACAYEAQGAVQPLARRSYRADVHVRIVAALNALSGQVTYQQQAVIGLKELPQFWRAVRAAYPQAETIYVVLDNWPIHFHPDVLACLAPQRDPWPVRKPGNWPSAPQPEGAAPGPADPVAVSAVVCLVVQSDREAVALATPERVAPAPAGRRLARPQAGGRHGAGRL